MPVDTANQVVCTVDQTDGVSLADIQWNRIGPQATPLNACPSMLSVSEII